MAAKERDIMPGLMTDQQLINIIKFMIEVEKKTNEQCRKELGLGYYHFDKLRKQIAIEIPCKKCGKKFVRHGTQKYCPACAEGSEIEYWRKNNNINRKKKQTTEKCEKSLINQDTNNIKEDEMPVYHRIPALKIGDIVNIKTKSQIRKCCADNETWKEYHIQHGIIEGIYKHGVLIKNDKGVREFISFIELKIGKYVINMCNDKSEEHIEIVNG